MSALAAAIAASEIIAKNASATATTSLPTATPAPTAIPIPTSTPNPNAAPNKTAKKFPKYITDNNNLVFEAAPPSEKDLKEKAAYEETQKQDYLKALRYAEEQLLTIAPKAWTAEKLFNAFKDLYKITCATLLTHKFNFLDKETFSGFRTSEIHTFKENPPQTPGLILKNYRYNLRSVDKVAEVFQILASGYDRDIALNFVKWYIKWMRLPTQELLRLDSLLDHKLLDLAARKASIGPRDTLAAFATFMDVEKWHKENFGRLDLWLEQEFAKKPQFRFPEGHIDTNTFLPLRANQAGLYSEEELAARDRVIKHYPLANEMPSRMLNLAITLVEKIKAGIDPISIAAFVHQEIAVTNHPYLNGNHRIARIMMNTVLVAFGYPAIDFKADADRRAYYQASEQGERDARIFEKLVRDAVSKQLANDTCVAARDGNIKRLTWLVEKLGASVDRPANPANGWTPLHFACKKGGVDAAAYLIGKGANLKPKPIPGVQLAEPLEMLAKPEDKTTLLKLANSRVKS